MRPWILGVTCAFALVAAPRAARGQAHELKHDVSIDVAVTATAAALVVGAEIGKRDLAPATCRVCDRSAGGEDTLNGLDASARGALRWKDPRVTSRVSDALGFLGVPLASFTTVWAAGRDAHAGPTTGVDMLLVGESVTLAAVANETVKLVVGRERPFVHALGPDEKKKTKHPSDNNLSFYSGHTSLTFSLAAASGTIASLRGYRLAPLVWATCTTLAATTGYLRIAADKHYLTDVLTGAVIGTAFGVLVPLLFHGRRDDGPAEAAALPSAQTASLGGSF